MGKTAGTKILQTKAKGGVKQAALQKSISNVSFKRLLMLQRRICSLVDEKSSWAEKNKNLSDSFKAEKLMNATLRKESYHWQRLYHEAMITINSYKVKQAEIAQVLNPCLREIDSIYPLMVGFSEAITSNKIRISGLLNSLPSEYECLPMHCKEGGRASDLNKKSGKPMKQRVGPMVRGMLITKPKIMLERVIMPQTQDQDPRSAEIEESSEVNDHLTPIQEENEQEPESTMRNVSMRPKRSKLGTSWKTKIKEKNDIQLGRGRNMNEVVGMSGVVDPDYNLDSSDAESNPATVEPVVRFKDVSRLLQNSSLMKLDGNRSGNGESAPLIHCEQKQKMNVRPTDDPLEGSSWMHPNNLRNPFGPPRKRTSLYKSESSDDEEELLVEQNVANTSTKNSLVITNQTFVVAKNSLDSPLPDIDKDCINQPAEPDSTNNDDTPLSDHFSSMSSHNSNNSSSCSVMFNKSSIHSNSPSDNPNSANTSAASSVSSVLKVRLSNLILVSRPSSTHNSMSKIEQEGSSTCNNCVVAETILPQVPEKRLRKPKCHLYPGEEDPRSLPRRSSSIGKKSIENKKAKKTVSVKQRRSVGKGQSKSVLKKSENSVQGPSDKILKNVKESTADMKIGKKSTKRSSVLKRSIQTPRSSSFGAQSLTENGDATRPKRGKQNICYKESPLNAKQRRP